MKLNKLFAAFMLIAATVFVGCEPQNPPGGPGNGQDTTVVTPNDPTKTGNGTLESPYTADDVIALAGSVSGTYYVEAYIVGQVVGVSMTENSEFAAPFTPSSKEDGTLNTYNTNILIASAAGVTDVAKCVPVQLPSGPLRSGLNLVENPDMLGQKILIYGSLEKYFGAAGIKNPSYAKVGDKNFGIDPSVEQKEPTAKVVTIKEFIDAPEYTESLVYYELTGVISGLSAGGNAVIYGNFNLTDETGTVYVYGLDKAFTAVGNTKADKSFGELGLKDGDKITLRGLRGSYNGKIEVMGAYFVKLISSGNENPNPGGNGDNNGDNNGNDDNTGTTPPEGAIVFDADTEKGNAGTDSNNATSYTITKDGVTITVSSGILGTYNNEAHYRIYKNQTLTVTSTVGNVKKVSFTCTANDDTKYGPGCFTWSTGDYTYSGPTGTWTGDAAEVVFTASSNQVRASQIVVEL